MEDEILTPEQVASTLQVTLITVYRRLRDKRLPGIRVGNRWRVRRSDLEKVLNKSVASGKQI